MSWTRPVHRVDGELSQLGPYSTPFGWGPAARATRSAEGAIVLGSSSSGGSVGALSAMPATSTATSAGTYANNSASAASTVDTATRRASAAAGFRLLVAWLARRRNRPRSTTVTGQVVSNASSTSVGSGA